MAKIEHIKNKRGEVIYPVSKEGAIYDENGVLLSTKIATFITRLVDNLANYYLKSETYTKGEVDELIGAIQGFTYIVVSELPTASAETMGIVYLVPSEDPQTQNVKDEYITIRSGVEGSYTYSWEQIGSTAIDLSGYVTTEALNTALANYTTTANLTTLLAGKQDTISDLSTIRSGAAAGATAYQKPGTGIPATDMASGVQTSLGKADSAYQKPSGGIPKTDLESGVQGSLELADSAVQADPIGSIVPPVDPSEFATKEEVEGLEAKVDDLSTGKYYGYFAQEEDLPVADVDGFAYVGEGPTYTIYNLRGGVWTSSDISVNQSPIGNEEDIGQNEDGKLQFANRTYNAQQPNGMGYKILRKNATFSSQVTDTNTIYEIRHDFDLGGNDVEMPLGCVLRFNGGHLSNGTLVGSGTQLQDLYDGCLLCDFGGTFTNMTIKASSVGLVPQGNAINVQDSFVRLAKLISATEEIVVEFAPGIYGFGNGGKTQLVPGGGRGYYNYPAIYIPANANNKKLKIVGNNAKFIRIGTTYIGKFDFSGATPVIDTTTEQSYKHWSQGGGFLYYGADGILEISECTIDGNMSNATFGGHQTATQECIGIVCDYADFYGEGLVIKNFVTNAIGAGSLEHFTVKDCEFSNNIRWGISTGRCEKFLVEGCVFNGNGRFYKVNEYYRFEGNWGDIDLERNSDIGIGNILIKDSRFYNTGGQSCIVSTNGNIDSFVLRNCVFRSSSTRLSYVSTTGADIQNIPGYPMAINLGTVKGLMEVSDVTLENYTIGYASRGETPLSSYVPDDISETPILFYKKPERLYTYFRNIKLTFTEDCVGYMASGTSSPTEAFVMPSTCYNYEYNPTTQKWSKVTKISSPYNTYHYGEAIFENIVINIIPNLCIGNASATDNYSPLTSEIHGMTINVAKASPKNYIKTFKSNADFLLKLTGLIINDYNQGDATIFGESIFKTIGDGAFVYNNYGNGNYSLRLESRFGNAQRIPEMTPPNPICGSTANRPSGKFVVQGTMYYDYQLNKPIWYKGNNVWVDATGATV